MDEDPSVSINAIKRSYTIVDEICDRDRAGATEIADALGLPKSTVHNHLRTLATLGYLVEEDGTYRLGARYLHLGQKSRNSRTVFQHGRGAVEALAAQSGRYCQLAVEENGETVVIQSTQWIPDEGARPAQQTYPMRAHLHTRISAGQGAPRTPAVRTDYGGDRSDGSGFLDGTDRDGRGRPPIRTGDHTRAGVRRRPGELVSGMLGVAAPIATERTVHGAVAAYGAGHEMREALDEGLPDLVKETADDIRADIVFDSLE